jgi:sulfofructose kinase
MVALARLGLKARYVGRVGSDDFGRMQLASIAGEGVDVSECRVVDGVESQIAVILVDERSGERTVLWRRDSRIAVLPDEVSPDLVTTARALHVDGHNVEAEAAAARWAREAGVPITVDVDKDYGGAPLYPLVDYLITSEEFPERVTGIADHRTALAALHERFGCAVVAATLGVRGAIALCEGVYIEAPGFAVAAKDTTGAGDAFRGGFLYGLLGGLDLEGTLRTANAVAALNCTALGARGGLPTASELDAFLRAH